MSRARSLPIDENALFKRDYILSEEQRPRIDHYIESVESDIRAFDEEILDQEDRLAGLRDNIVRLRSQRSEKDKLLQKLRFTISAIRRVPLDVWLEVFKWLSYLHQQDGPDAMRISIPWQTNQRSWQYDLKQTCSAWREAAIHSQILWRDIMVVAPWCGDDREDETEYTRDEEDRWIARLHWALDMLPATGSAIVGIDLGKLNHAHRRACELAIKHLYDPLLDPSRQLHVAIAVRGSCYQIGAVFAMELAHPEKLEHLILRDSGRLESDGSVFFDQATNSPLVERFFRIASNLRRVEIVGETSDTTFLENEYGDFPFDHIPWNQLTHLVIDHQFHDRQDGEFDLLCVVDTLITCKNLVHLVLLVDAIDLSNHDDPGEWIAEPSSRLELSFLESLIVSFDLENFFRCLHVPSLSRLEIRNKGYYPLNDISQLIKQSRCSIQSFAEITPSKPLSSNAVGKLASRRRTTNKSFNQLLRNLQDVKIFRTLTKLDKQDLRNIASSQFLPQVKVLQFYTGLPLASVIQTLKPRFKSIVNASHHHGLDEVIVHYSGRPPAVPSISPHYVDGTRVEMLYEDTVAYRIKINK